MSDKWLKTREQLPFSNQVYVAPSAVASLFPTPMPMKIACDARVPFREEHSSCIKGFEHFTSLRS